MALSSAEASTLASGEPVLTKCDRPRGFVGAELGGSSRLDQQWFLHWMLYIDDCGREAVVTSPGTGKAFGRHPAGQGFPRLRAGSSDEADPAPSRAGTAVGGALATCAAVIATVMASRDVTA